MNSDRNGDILRNLLKAAIPRKHFCLLSSSVRLQRDDAQTHAAHYTKKEI